MHENNISVELSYLGDCISISNPKASPVTAGEFVLTTEQETCSCCLSCQDFPVNHGKILLTEFNDFNSEPVTTGDEKVENQLAVSHSNLCARGIPPPAQISLTGIVISLT